jgi:hypothetical protein
VEMQVVQGECPLAKMKVLMITWFYQRESSATIKAAPVAYQQASPPTSQKILEFDCRGLEFTEFMPDVSIYLIL